MCTSWESEDLLVDEYEALIKANREPSVPMHFADLVIAIALRRFDEESTFAPARASGAEGWRHIREHLRTTLRALDALPIIAAEELKQNKHFMIPGIVQLKVSGMRPKKAAKPKSKATTVKAFPSRALKAAALRGGSSSSSSSSSPETLQLLSPPAALGALAGCLLGRAQS